MRKALTLIGILCLLLAFVLPIFVGPMSIIETPFWDSTPHSSTNPILGGDPGENPVRVNHWNPLQTFIVDGTYEFSRMEVYAQMCNYLPDELNSLTSFPEGKFKASLYNWTPEDGGDTPVPAPMLNLYYSITSEITSPSYISLKHSGDLKATVDPSQTYSLRFLLSDTGADYYDICLYRSEKDKPEGRGYINLAGWNPMPSGEGQDIAMRLYGTQAITNGNGNQTITEPDCDGDGISDVNDTDDDNDCQGTDPKNSVPLLTAFLFALGCVLLTATLISTRSMYGIIFYVIEFSVTFLLWYFWLFYAWTGIWV